MAMLLNSFYISKIVYIQIFSFHGLFTHKTTLNKLYLLKLCDNEVHVMLCLVSWTPQLTKNLTISNLIRWVDGMIVSLTKSLMFQVLLFFIISCKILCKNPFSLFFYSYKITEIKINSFEFPKSIKSKKNNNTWNIRLLVNDSFVPSSKQPSVIYCRLTDFKIFFKDVFRNVQNT